MDDIVSLLLYVVMILAAFIASAYQAKKRKAQQRQGPVTAERQEDQEAEGHPDLGPLGDFFDMQEKRRIPPEYETLEAGPSVEEEGDMVERSVIYEPMTPDSAGTSARSESNEVLPTSRFAEEGQPALTRMDATEDLTAYLTDEDVLEDIAAGEIVSEEEAEALAKKRKQEGTDWRKAIIYFEILKRREY